jgi:hypothetical protein
VFNHVFSAYSLSQSVFVLCFCTLFASGELINLDCPCLPLSLSRSPLLALLSTYTLSIGCLLLLLRRIRLLLPARSSTLKHPAPPAGPLVPRPYWHPHHRRCVPLLQLRDRAVLLPHRAAAAGRGGCELSPALWGRVKGLAAVVYRVYGRAHYPPPVLFVEGG